jgi:acetylornithine deacetylase/succinyl-diaminopimelate desuccinylase-like protein
MASGAGLPPELLYRLRAAYDPDAAVDLLRRAVRTPSVTGGEAAMAEMLQPEMYRLSLSPVVEEFLPGRPNIHGSREGATGAPRLLFMGHTDIVHPLDWGEHWKGQPQQDPFGAAVVEEELWGRGAADLKAGICASLAALDLLDRAGIRLDGSVSYAFVGDEESGEPGTGVSAGARRYAEKVAGGTLPRPDFAVYVEPTRLNVMPVQNRLLHR